MHSVAMLIPNLIETLDSGLVWQLSEEVNVVNHKSLKKIVKLTN
jgi:hypothetical protein